MELMETELQSVPMRRWLAIFLLVLLPLQSTWAAAAAYCQHEADAATKHFGHHDHKHHQGSSDKTDAPSFAADLDCAVCHAGFTAATANVPALALDLTPPALTPRNPHAPVSPPAAQPERPNWSFPV